MVRRLALAALLAAACATTSPRTATGPLAAQPPTTGAPPQGTAASPSSIQPAHARPGDAAAQPIVFAAVGDIMLGTTFPDGTALPPNDGADLLAEVAPVLQAADVAFGNLEGPLIDGGTSEKCKEKASGRCWAFRVPERYGQHLARAGFDVLSVANNHVGDFGDEGRARTRAVLDALGIRYSGAVGEVAWLEVRGRKIALVAYSVSAGTNDLCDVEGAARLVAELKAQADLVVVSFHGGGEGDAYQHVAPGTELFLGEDRGDLRRFTHAVIDAGAGLVLGHGPHVVRALELYRGRLVVYSLGNFATWGGMNLTGPKGLTLVLEAKVAPDGTFVGGTIHPARQDKPGGPRWDATGAVIPLLRALSQEDFGAAAPDIADDGTITVRVPGA